MHALARRLAREAAHIESHPGRAVLQALSRWGLSLLLAFGPMLPQKSRRRIARSLERRDPARWEKLVQQALHDLSLTGMASGPTQPFAPRAAEPLPEFEGEPADAPPAVLPARLIAFYLPQFHPIPENDRWWGRGFTEWTNVTRARPQFHGHLQPRLPGELGFYDLRLPSVLARQAELARLHGISGFCLYLYWFGGKRLLEQPLELLYQQRDIDIGYCVCWANENWSRRWDGLDQELLIEQRHSADDDKALAALIARYMQDPRYLRVEGKPIAVIYRPSLLPDAAATAARWRAVCRAEGVGEIHLLTTLSFGDVRPEAIGFDGAIEFPPNNIRVRTIDDAIMRINPHFSGRVLDWQSLFAQGLPEIKTRLAHYRGVCPSWDNEPRRAGQGTVFLGSTPALYQRWLEEAITDTVKRFDAPSQRLVFINAWNEWAEGAFLEPDAHYGYAYLRATHAALIAANG